jgi:hypothetical protein
MTTLVWKSCCRVALMMTLLVSGASVSTAAITLTDPGLPGSVQADYWSNARLSSVESNLSINFPGTAAWPAPGFIASSTANVGSDGDAGLFKLANGPGGGPYPIGSAIYHGGTSETPNTLGGILAVQDATPLAGVSNIVFQVQIGEAYGYDFHNDVLPVLNYNGGSQAVAAKHALLIGHEPSGTFPDPLGGPDLPLFTNSYLLQWDVTGLGITSLSLNFSGVQHSLLYQLRLDQSSVFVDVPEPASLTLGGLALLGVVGLAWKKRRSR